MIENTNIYGVILAGGGGTRLWPLSRAMYPKQLLKLHNENTLFQSTVIRLSKVIPQSNIVTVTNIKHAPDIKIQLNELITPFTAKVVVEPVGRNTAPAVALSIFYILNQLHEDGSDPIILVAPSDHLVQCEEEFIKAVNDGAKLAEAGFIVTFGIRPQRPDTGFGYINTDKNHEVANIIEKSLKVKEFREKPDLQTAEEYCRQGTYFWNSGIFMFKASTMLNEMQLYSKDLIKGLKQSELSDEGPTIKFDDYVKLPETSIDYAVMEKTKAAVLIPIDCGWNDVGCWEAIYDVAQKDDKNNFISGNVVDIDSENSLIYSTSKLVSTIGLKDVILVETEDAILACDKNRTQDVKQVVEHLKKSNDISCMVHCTQYRSWGYSTVFQRGEGFIIKSIHVNPKSKQSLQMHTSRSDHWVVLEGTAKVVRGNDVIYLNPGESIDIPPQTKHSLENPSNSSLKIIEIQIGTKFEEDDVIRFREKAKSR